MNIVCFLLRCSNCGALIQSARKYLIAGQYLVRKGNFSTDINIIRNVTILNFVMIKEHLWKHVFGLISIKSISLIHRCESLCCTGCVVDGHLTKLSHPTLV